MDKDYFPLMPPDAKKDTRHRLIKYKKFLDAKKQKWYLPQLEPYKDDLLADDSLSESTVASHLGTVKQQYRRIWDEGNLEQLLGRLVPQGQDKATFVAQALKAIEIATQPDTAYVRFTRSLEIEHLSQKQVEALIGQIQVKKPIDYRDVIAIGFLLGTGMSEVELCELKVSDIVIENHNVKVHIPEVSGGKERTVRVWDTLFHDKPWVARYITRWLEETGIKEGPLLRGFYRGGKTYRKNKMSVDAVQRLLQGYPVPDENGQPRTFTVLDLRRTFARRLFDNGMELEDIRKILGHESILTTHQYMGLPERQSNNIQRGAGQSLINKIDPEIPF